MDIKFPSLAPCSHCKSLDLIEFPTSAASRCEDEGRELEGGEEEVTSEAFSSLQITRSALTAATLPSEAEEDRAEAVPPSHPSVRGKASAGIRRNNRRAPSSSSTQRRHYAASRRRRVYFGFRGHCAEKSFNDLALPLGMSIAAVISRVLDKHSTTDNRALVDYISVICRSAVRESVETVFGDSFDAFLVNFEKSFQSTLKTLRLLNEARVESLCTFAEEDTSEPPPPPAVHAPESTSAVDENEIHEDTQSNYMGHQLVLRGLRNQELAHVLKSSFGSVYSQSVVSTLEKSVIEQARSNELKEVELALRMEKLRTTKSQLALTSEANSLRKAKISFGISKTLFKEEKHKNQLQDARHTELKAKCIDCLVAGLLIMSVCLFYGTYIYSYQRIMDATVSCTSLPESSKSWWLPKPVASVNLVLHTLRCHVITLSRMLFGLFMILALAYLLLQRSSSSTHPVTFILLLLGAACGFTGKMCIDTLGGSGYLWLLYWEPLCLIHLFANIFTHAMFDVLHGPITVSPSTDRVKFPYWLRRVVFYGTVLFFLPVLCGLMPFGTLDEWREHFFSLVVDKLFNGISDGS